MRRACPVLLLVLLAASSASASRSTEVRKAYGALIGSMVPRKGVQYRR